MARRPSHPAGSPTKETNQPTGSKRLGTGLVSTDHPKETGMNSFAHMAEEMERARQDLRTINTASTRRAFDEAVEKVRESRQVERARRRMGGRRVPS